MEAARELFSSRNNSFAWIQFCPDNLREQNSKLGNVNQRRFVMYMIDIKNFIMQKMKEDKIVILKSEEMSICSGVQNLTEEDFTEIYDVVKYIRSKNNEKLLYAIVLFTDGPDAPINLFILRHCDLWSKELVETYMPFKCYNIECTKVETNIKFNQCSKCKINRYCSRECQVIDWKTHQKECCEPKEISTLENLTYIKINNPSQQHTKRMEQMINTIIKDMMNKRNQNGLHYIISNDNNFRCVNYSQISENKRRIQNYIRSLTHEVLYSFVELEGDTSQSSHAILIHNFTTFDVEKNADQVITL